ncbi:IS66 family transposase [Burkholderia anthina]|uniref:IS66 family transposase n=1 Tax=Burkholderia anthina TaxID=179879 RepID=UPI003C7C6215
MQKLHAGVQPGTALMADGYEPYSGIAGDHQLVPLGCWAHMHRGFVGAEESKPKAARSPNPLATRLVALIGKLFAAKARSVRRKPKRTQRLRTRRSARVPAIIEHMLVEQLPSVVLSSLLGKAFQYLNGQWPKPVRYVENSNSRISNNPCESALRPFVFGRKGWLFSDTVDGANASANLYSLVETSKAGDIDLHCYLTLLFKRRSSSTTLRPCHGTCRPICADG